MVTVADEADSMSFPTIETTDGSELVRGKDDGEDAVEVDDDEEETEEDEVDAEGDAIGERGGLGIEINKGICSALGLVCSPRI